MNCPHCGKKINDSKIAGEQASEKKAFSKVTAVRDWISTDAWKGYLEINCY